MNQNEMKQAAAEAAIRYVEDGSVVGVGVIVTPLKALGAPYPQPRPWRAFPRESISPSMIVRAMPSEISFARSVQLAITASIAETAG